MINKTKVACVTQRLMTANLRPCLNCKPSGVERLGDVPTHWEVRRLKNVCTRPSQNKPSSSNISTRQPPPSPLPVPTAKSSCCANTARLIADVREAAVDPPNELDEKAPLKTTRLKRKRRVLRLYNLGFYLAASSGGHSPMPFALWATLKKQRGKK